MRGQDCILNFSVDRNEVSWRNVFLSSTMINNHALKTYKTKTTKLRKKRSTQLLSEGFLTKLINDLSKSTVITSICNETIFHLIMKSTLAKLCGVGIVYLIFLLTEMKCHGEMFSYFNCLTYHALKLKR
jgi:hypothetical protein